MYEMFTDRSRKVMQLANQAAQGLNHEYIGTEHILIGLVREGSGVASSVLRNMDVSLHRIEEEVRKIVQPRTDVVTLDKLPPTPRTRDVIKFAHDEARILGHNYVGTEHLLLGCLREAEGIAAQILTNLGLKLEDVRREIHLLLGTNKDSKRAKAIELRNEINAKLNELLVLLNAKDDDAAPR